MNRVKAPVSAYPVKRIALLVTALAFFGTDECPGHAERILALGIAVAPEHIRRWHVAVAAGIHSALPPTVHIRHRQVQAKARGRHVGTAMFGIGIAEHD